jgi:outer membrane biosynthesis protein TonB
VNQGPLAVAIGVSVGLHLLLLAVVFFMRVPANEPMVKRGEPLFVELPQAEEAAQRGAPPGEAPAPKAPPTPAAPPTPPVAKAPPQPRVAPSPPQPPQREARAAQPRQVPEQPAPPSQPTRPATPEPPAPDGLQAATPPDQPQPSEPALNEPARPAEAQPREATPPAPPQPRVAAVPPRPPLIDSRSVLRRGGPAGAGGSGEGWAGIEGEPIPLDSSDPKYNDYLDRVRRMIKEKWGYPCVKNMATGHCDYKSARLVIVFGILKDGRVPVVAVAQVSGYDVYDEYAKNAILLAQPFPPVPASLLATAKSGSSGVKIVAAFHYQLVESSLTNILR